MHNKLTARLSYTKRGGRTEYEFAFKEALSDFWHQWSYSCLSGICGHGRLNVVVMGDVILRLTTYIQHLHDLMITGLKLLLCGVPDPVTSQLLWSQPWSNMRGHYKCHFLNELFNIRLPIRFWHTLLCTGVSNVSLYRNPWAHAACYVTTASITHVFSLHSISSFLGATKCG